jgi:ribosomal protein S11
MTSTVGIDAPDALDHLLCPVCSEIPDGHVFQCVNGHLLCAVCYERMRGTAIRRPACPLCRAAFPDFVRDCGRNREAEREISALSVACEHCAETMPRGSLASHALICPAAPDVECSMRFDGCSWKGRASERRAHEAICGGDTLRAQFDFLGRAISSHLDARAVDRMLYAAAREGHGSVVRALLWRDGEMMRDQAVHVLFIAASKGHDAIVTALAANGVDVTREIAGGWTALHLAAGAGREAMVTALVNAGADVEKTTNDGSTPLGLAARNGHEAVVAALLNARAKDEERVIS